MKNADTVEQLRSELRQDLYFIELNFKKNREMTERIEENKNEDEYQFAALGYTIHNLYNSFESYFLRIAKFFENNIDNLEWHSSLVEQMSLDIDGVRPALFDIAFSVKIGEMMRFRHLFRNLYKTPLIPQKVLFANDYAPEVFREFSAHHKRFDTFLAKLKANLADEDER